MASGTQDVVTVLTVGGRKYACSSREQSEVEARLLRCWRAQLVPLRASVARLRTMWDAHDQARRDAFFLVPAVVDRVNKVRFPPEGVVNKAEAAMSQLEAAVKAGDLARCCKSYGPALAEVDGALRAVRGYHEGIVLGAPGLVSGLEGVKKVSVIFLQVAGAVATGGSSMAVGASVSAAVGSYEALIKQIEDASKPGEFDMGRAVGTVVIKGVAEGLAEALFHETSFAKKTVDQLAKKMAGKSFDAIKSGLARAVLEKVWQKSIEGAAKGSLKMLVAKASYDKKMTLDDAAAHVADEMVKTMGGILLNGILGKQVEAFSKDSTKFLKPEFFKGLGKVDLKKAMNAGGEKVIEVAFEKYMEKHLLEAANDGTDFSKVLERCSKAIGSDPKVLKELSALAAKRR